MKRLVLFLGVMVLATAAFAQEAADLSTKDLVAQIGPLRVARTLKLRQDQVAKITPLLEQVKAAREAQKTGQDAILARAGSALARVDQALLRGQRPLQGDITIAQRAGQENRTLLAATDRAIDAAAQQVYALLDAEQAQLIESPQQQQQARQAEAARAKDTAMAGYIGNYVAAMRKLAPQEYDTLRVAMALRIAGMLVSPDNRNFNVAVNDALRLMDTVRGMSDADFAQRAAELPQAVGRALRLNVSVDTPLPAGQMSYGSLTDFVAGDQTLEALAAYVPAPPLEGQK